MAVIIGIASRERATDERRNEKQGEEIPPLEDVKTQTTGVERSVLWRFLGELVDSFCYAYDSEDPEDGGGESENCEVSVWSREEGSGLRSEGEGLATGGQT